jgi:secreted PhoX family phosphatase
MKRAFWIAGVVAAATAFSFGPRLIADADVDWGALVQREMNERSEQLFGVGTPLAKSALGPYTAADSTQAIKVAEGLRVSLVSSAVHFSTDQIVLWPNDKNPKYLFVCDESSSNPAVQRVDLSKPAASNATTILTGIVACDPIRRTPWGSLLAGEEASDGGVYEIMNPLSITAPIAVTNRATGATSDPRVVKRKALGQLAFEGNPVLPDGTIIFGDELRPGGGNPGGAIYKFVPDHPYFGSAVITSPTSSPFVSGQLYGLKIGSAGDNGQGAEIGEGRWVEIDEAAIRDANGNIPLRLAQASLKLNGFYRPEDMDIDPVALANDEIRECWTDTGRMSNGGGSVEETSAIYGEVMCITEEYDPTVVSDAVPTVTRFIAGGPQFNYFDNVAFQPHTGNLVVTEDGEVAVVKEDGTTEQRGNDLLMCLPDGNDNDVQSDGCVRIASLRDTSSEPTGPIFNAAGDTLYLSLQHRATGVGALIKITGFQVGHGRRDRHDDGESWGPGWRQRGRNRH